MISQNDTAHIALTNKTSLMVAVCLPRGSYHSLINQRKAHGKRRVQFRSRMVTAHALSVLLGMRAGDLRPHPVFVIAEAQNGGVLTVGQEGSACKKTRCCRLSS